MLEIASVCRARVSATYRALSSSRWRSVVSIAKVSTAQAGGWLSLARNTNLTGAADSPGQSTSTPMVSSFRGWVPVSNSSTVSASKPLAPWIVSRRTAFSTAAAGACTPPALRARTKAYGVA